MLKKLLMLSFVSLYSSAVFSGEKLDKNLQAAYSLQETLAQVAKKALPAVVIVKTAKRIKQYYYINPMGPGGYFSPQGKIFSRESPPIPSGQASGFIFDPKGYILTNYHVVRDQSNFKIVLYDGSEHRADIIGVDSETDLAVLKIKTGKKLPYLKFADSKKVKVGHLTIAVGAPFGLEHTVTTGIVSFKGRSSHSSYFHNFIQTDAAINPGNSGGPLLNLAGEVIGVNDFIICPPGSQGNIGLGFAISSQVAEKISRQLMTKGKAEKPWLGIGMTALSTEQKTALQMSHGVIVSALYNQGPAQQGGLLNEDIIVKLNGVDIATPNDIQKEVVNHLPGQTVEMEIIRKGITKTIKLKLGVKPKQLFLDQWRTNEWSTE